MKTKLLLLFLVILTTVACKDVAEQKNELIDSYFVIKINGVYLSDQTKSTNNEMPILDSLSFITRYAAGWSGTWNYQGNAESPISRGFDFFELYGTQRDTINNKLLLLGEDVIYYGKLGMLVTQVNNIVIEVDRKKDGGQLIHPKYGAPGADRFCDTVAYIPNKTVLKARNEITEAFNKGDYNKCYELFDKAYVFVPTTGAKWRAMKAAGIE